MRHTLTGAALVAAAMAQHAAAAPPPGFSGLGTGPGGAYAGAARAVSADGSVVVGGGGEAEAFRWTRDTGRVRLGPGIATCVSAAGDIVGGGTGSSMFWWSAPTGRINLQGTSGEFRPTNAYGLSADGQTMVGTGGDDRIAEAIAYRRGTGIVRLGDLPGGATNAVAYAVSASGAAVFGGGSTPQSGPNLEAFLYAPGLGFTSLGELPGGVHESIAFACSDSGGTAFGISGAEYGRDAFRWTAAGGMQALHGPQAGMVSPFLFGSSGDGTLACGFAIKDGVLTAVVWSASSGWHTASDFLALNGVTPPAGWTLDTAHDISSDGRTIVGRGINPAGRDEAWTATIPSPASFVVFAAAFPRMRRRADAAQPRI